MPTTKHPLEMSITEVARHFNKSTKTIQRWVKSGFLLTRGYRIRVDPRGYSHIIPPQHETWETLSLDVDKFT